MLFDNNTFINIVSYSILFRYKIKNVLNAIDEKIDFDDLESGYFS